MLLPSLNLLDDKPKQRPSTTHQTTRVSLVNRFKASRDDATRSDTIVLARNSSVGSIGLRRANTPVAVIFPGNNSELISNVFKEVFNDFDFATGASKAGEALDEGGYNLLWKPTCGYRSSRHQGVCSVFDVPIKDARDFRVINHFPRNNILCTKTLLFRHLERYYLKQRVQVDEVVPMTYIISSLASAEWANFEKKAFKMHRAWICKPSGLNCGRGIEVHDDIRGIAAFIRSAQSRSVVIQKYIPNPLLWPKGNRKFDIRMWVLLTEDGHVFMGKQGYLRTCSESFSFDNINNSTAHLTNYTLQRKSDALGKYEDGNTLSFDDLQDLLNSNADTKNIDVQKDIIPRFAAIVMDTIRATWKKLSLRPHANAATSCFELFGYDFLLDNKIKPWLIEVNTNPFLGVQNKWHGELLKTMVSEMATIIKHEYYCGKPNRSLSFFQRIDKTPKPPKGRGRVMESWLTLRRPSRHRFPKIRKQQPADERTEQQQQQPKKKPTKKPFR